MKVTAYKDQNGNRPYLEWLNNLKDSQTKLRIQDRIKRIEIFDYFGNHKIISNNLYELKFYFGKGYRVYFTKRNNQIVILLGGGDKTTQNKDIKKAKIILKEIENDN